MKKKGERRFSQCCSEVYESKGLGGNWRCWGGALTYEGCCSISPRNGNSAYIPKQTFYKPKLMVDLAALNRTVVVHQAGFIERYEAREAAKPDVGPDGVLWKTGYKAAQFVAAFEFPGVAPEPPGGKASFPPRKFLELAAAVGAPSLAALVRGFHVITTDLFDRSVAQRLRSAAETLGGLRGGSRAGAARALLQLVAGPHEGPGPAGSLARGRRALRRGALPQHRRLLGGGGAGSRAPRPRGAGRRFPQDAARARRLRPLRPRLAFDIRRTFGRRRRENLRGRHAAGLQLQAVPRDDGTGF